ncbi:MAG: bifunctional phosphoribosyl-AMP cyclohydrolase/phosphoribosyl-ATP diphosphatase HisIE [Eubacterium sp.]|nr:bifunctional phosphoribosyl-AMP cyclohydrolase/phosphoribosyl-ATP diphosphatase HisIE [Eubacterium sp.]
MDRLFTIISLKPADEGFTRVLVNGAEINAPDGSGSENIVIRAAVDARNSGKTGIFVFDYSETDADHDRAIGLARLICREAYIPVYMAGRVNRLEDIKKILYAGCEKAFVNMAKDNGTDLLQEGSERFGRSRVGSYIPDLLFFEKNKETVEKYAGILMADKHIADSLAGNTDLPILSVEKNMAEMRELQTPREEVTATMDWSEFKTDANGLLPCVVQDYKNGDVLMVAWMNEDAFNVTLQTGRMTYWSRSRQELWTKGLTSGHLQFVKELVIDCDKDTLLAKVDQVGAACHTGNRSCFYRPILKKQYEDANPQKVLQKVFDVIMDRRANPREGSYTNYLFDKGIDKILKKVGEESAEIIIAAKNPDKEESIYEMCDFLYHMMVLMVEKGLTWEDLTRELANRES